MSDTEDDWFNKSLSEFTIDKKANDNDTESQSQASTIIVRTRRNDNAVHHDNNRIHQAMTNHHSPPMSLSKLRYITEQTPVVAFLEIMHPDSGFFDCIKRKSNSLATILLLAKAVCNACRVPFDESVKCLCDCLVDEQHFWNQCIKYLTESTSLPPSKPYSKARPQNDDAASNAEDIWNSVTALCRAIVNHEIRLSKTFLKQVIQLIENNKNDRLILDQHLIELKAFLHNEQPTSSRNLLPSLDEIKTGNLAARNVPSFNGNYRDVSHYIDIHLALLRVDFLLPIRCAAEGIISKEGVQEGVYRHVEILITEKEYRSISRPQVKKTVCIVADLESERRKQITGPSYYSVNNYDQRLTIGSLLFFTTSDAFNDLIIAKVQSRNAALLERGYIDIVIVKTYNIASILDQSFIMYERRPYFYREIYEALKNFTENTFPLRTNLIGADPNVGYPTHVPDQQKVIYKYRKHKVDIKSPTLWSSSQEATSPTFNLAATQLDALQRSLTHKLCAISTSNYDEGVVIASEIIATLFQNTDRRILIVCHSGKALTKILADIEMYTDDIARIANHNVNDQLDQFNLKQIHSDQPDTTGIYKLINAYRYKLHSGYREAVNEFTALQLQMKECGMQDTFMNKYLRVQMQLESFSKRLDEMRQIADFECIKTKRIIGINSYGASKFQTLIELLQSPIVIIEGAHNILEAHTTATLTTNLEHLILIGQNKLSKSKRHTSTFALSKIYNVNFSLLERLLIASGQQTTKKVTNRVGPTILNILYNRKKLECPIVMGTNKFVFVLEPRPGRSNTIEFESHFILALCNYFLKQGYDPSDIVMLAMNCHHMQQIVDDRKMYEDRAVEFANLCKVRVDFVMNFKEKNNGIVLLSTAETTRDADSAKRSQEVRHLFSRAKLAFYVIGSLPGGKHLKKIGNAIGAEAAIDVKMELVCQTHGNVTKVEEASDIDKLQYGGCETICNQPLRCGHLCKNVCHTAHYSHQECLCNDQTV